MSFRPREFNRYHRSPILPVGSQNLRTGENRYFNTFENNGKDGTAILLTDISTPKTGGVKPFIVIGAGSKEGYYPVGEKLSFRHDQSFQRIRDGEVIGKFDTTPEGFAQIESIVRRKSIPAYVFK